MTIKFTVSGTNYSLELDGSQYTLNRHSINQDKESKNFGNETVTALGYYSQIKNALNKAVKTELGSSTDEIDLKEFLIRYEGSMDAVSKQLGDGTV